MKVTITVNGKAITDEILPDLTLVDFLRGHGMRSVKRGCETSNCGACTVHLDGKAVLSCGILAARCDGHEVTTLEGVRDQAEEFGGFIADENAEQCGYCSPGLIMCCLAMFAENPDPSDDEVKEYLANNLCRCSGYEGQMRGIHRYIAWKKEQNRKESVR
jgi:carbon-monoxide dehydrogenase small subunit